MLRNQKFNRSQEFYRRARERTRRLTSADEIPAEAVSEVVEHTVAMFLEQQKVGLDRFTAEK